MAQCAQCKTEFETRRSTARFCSDVCRSGYAKAQQAGTLTSRKPVTSRNAKVGTLTTGGDPPVTVSAFADPKRRPPGNGYPPAYDGPHACHQIFPHDHQPVGSLYKPCSGRWFCETCKPDDYPGTWFSAVACYEVAS